MVKFMNKETIIKAFKKSASLSNEELQKIMELTLDIDAETLLEILLENFTSLNEEELTRILKLIPIEHQYLLELLVSLMDDNEYAEEIEEIIANIKYDLVNKAKEEYEKAKDFEKEDYKLFLKSLTKEEANYLLSEIKSDKKTEFAALTKKEIKESLEDQKKITM